MNSIIALWTHPRSVSTAFERVMMERKDFNVIHEPFSYLYYVHQDQGSISQQYVDPDYSTDYDGIKSHIEHTADTQSVFFKDMGAHCFDDLISDDAFLQRLTNTFLIRNPAKAIASFYAMNPDVTIEEIGLKQLYGIYEKVVDLGTQPVVVDADDLEDDPAGTMNAYCETLGIPYIPDSLTWESGHQVEWDIWTDWHKDAAQSTGIQKAMETFEVTVDNSKRLKEFFEDQFPYYQKLYAQRTLPITPE